MVDDLKLVGGVKCNDEYMLFVVLFYVFLAMRRYEAAAWLRKMVGVVGARDLPAEPSEEEFRIGLRSGLILCNVLNKIQPGAVSKVQVRLSFVYAINWTRNAFELIEDVLTGCD